MTSKKTMILSLVMIGLGLHFAAMSLHAQGGDKFKGRLAPVPALEVEEESVVGR